MAHQVERELKLLLDPAGVRLPEGARRRRIRQVYFLSGLATIRLRAYDDGPFEVTFKFDREGDGRDEFDLGLDADGERFYQLALAAGFPEISKTRYALPAQHEGLAGLTWEVDLFDGRYGFLALAELEYQGPERPTLEVRPSWYPEGPWPVDVTDSGVFRNSHLVHLNEAAVGDVRREFEALLEGAKG